MSAHQLETLDEEDLQQPEIISEARSEADVAPLHQDPLPFDSRTPSKLKLELSAITKDDSQTDAYDQLLPPDSAVAQKTEKSSLRSSVPFLVGQYLEAFL